MSRGNPATASPLLFCSGLSFPANGRLLPRGERAFDLYPRTHLLSDGTIAVVAQGQEVSITRAAGRYMLFLVGPRDVPSVATWIRIRQ